MSPADKDSPAAATEQAAAVGAAAGAAVAAQHGITVDAVESAAERGASKAVALTFLHLGYDITDKDQVRELKENFEFLKHMSRGSREIRHAAIKTCVGAMVLGCLTALWLGITTYFPRPH